jgi:hypothetical protein
LQLQLVLLGWTEGLFSSSALSDKPIRRSGKVGNIMFAKKNTSNLSEFNLQYMDDNFAKETLDFVNVNFTKPLEL